MPHQKLLALCYASCDKMARCAVPVSRSKASGVAYHVAARFQVAVACAFSPVIGIGNALLLTFD